LPQEVAEEDLPILKYRTTDTLKEIKDGVNAHRDLVVTKNI
jgi:hypothetical protein